MSILKSFDRYDYLHKITDGSNHRIEKYWKEQQEKDNATNHHIHIGDAPLVSHAQVAAVIDAIEAAQQNAQADDGWCHCPPPLPTTGIDELEFCNGCQRPRR